MGKVISEVLTGPQKWRPEEARLSPTLTLVNQLSARILNSLVAADDWAQWEVTPSLRIVQHVINKIGMQGICKIGLSWLYSTEAKKRRLVQAAIASSSTFSGQCSFSFPFCRVVSPSAISGQTGCRLKSSTQYHNKYDRFGSSSVDDMCGFHWITVCQMNWSWILQWFETCWSNVTGIKTKSCTRFCLSGITFDQRGTTPTKLAFFQESTSK